MDAHHVLKWGIKGGKVINELMSMRPRTPFRVQTMHDRELVERLDGRPAMTKNGGALYETQLDVDRYRYVSLQQAVDLIYESISTRSKLDDQLREDVLQAGLGHPLAQEKIKAIIAFLLVELRIEVDPTTLIAPMDATDSIFAQTCGAGLLEDLYKMRDVEEIQVNGCEIFVVKGGIAEKHVRKFQSLEEVRLLQDRLALCGKKPINENNPVRQTYMHNKSRLVMTRERYSDVPTICIRNFIVRNVTLESLQELGTLNVEMAALLSELVRCHASIIVGGSTNTGKTTMLYALSREIPVNERIITLEKEFEITLRDRLAGARNIVSLREVQDVGLSMEEAFKPILVMSPNWVVIGEAKGAEVAQMIQGSLRGHDIMGTMHTKYRNSFFTDVIDMVKQDGRVHDDQSLRSRIARAFNILIFLRLIHVEGRLRRVITEITELSADENDQVSVRPIVLWNYESQTWQFTGEKLSRSLVEHMRTRQTDMNEFRRLGVIN